MTDTILLLGVFPILSTIVFLPLVGALLLYIIPGFSPEQDTDGDRVRYGALIFSLATFILSAFLLSDFEPSNVGMQFQEHATWIPSYGISYSLGVDGISILLVMLTTFLMPLVVLASHSVKKNVRAYLFHMLALESAMLGTLVALDVFLFYVFWELMLAPMYFIIGIWGGKRRIYATLKFVLYTVVGSLLMLLAIFYTIWNYAALHGGEVTFALSELVSGVDLSFDEQLWLFLAFALAFGIKVPLFPFHTWLPDAHVEAPTGGSVVLAGVLLKMGLYGFIRFAFPLFPEGAEAFAPILAGLAVIGIVYGALVAWAQEDMKKLVAYSSVSHLGYCVLGFVALNTLATTGSLYQMLNHGISTGALFLLVGVLYDRKHTRAIKDYGGLASQVPIFAFLFLVFTLSSIALPLTNGFVGEFMILTGSFQTFPILTAFAVLGVIFGAVYMLTLYMRTMYGEMDVAKNGDLTDVTKTELMTFAPLFVLVFVMGVFPQPFLRVMEPTVKHYVSTMESRRQGLKPALFQGGDAVVAYAQVNSRYNG
ncbi:MAG: NADH-quinone oxidoreductase subunit M [Bdellovibrionales bacterium]|nr:NADH-quinone oxidoreductase subunit M [Bdellovibrionales bacterium]